MIISLIGFMGSGKSSVGRRLADLLSFPFIDLDAEIEIRAGMSITAIFSAYGEPAFRKMEYETLSSVLAVGQDMVIATGGGTPVNPESAGMLRERTVCVYLSASENQLSEILSVLDNSNRPMLKKHTVGELMRARVPIYENTAHISVNLSDYTDGVPDDSAFDRIAGDIVAYLGEEKRVPGN